MSGSRRSLLVLLVLVLISGCHGRELSRSTAKGIMSKVASEAPVKQLTISLDQATKLMRIDKEDAEKAKEVMNFDGGKPCVPDASDVRVMTGQLVVCTTNAPAEVTWQKPGFLVPLRKPIYWRISDVTGIADDPKGPSDKIVEYIWNYDLAGLPKSVTDILTPTTPSKGSALLRRYDDGWRFVEFR